MLRRRSAVSCNSRVFVRSSIATLPRSDNKALPVPPEMSAAMSAAFA